MSRSLKLSTLLFSMLLLSADPATARSADKAEAARSLVKKGITFLGGEQTLKKYTGATVTESGTYYGMGEGLPYTAKYAVQYPDKFSMDIVGVFKQILNGNKGWVVSAGEVKEMTKAQVRAILDQHYVGMVSQLYPLLDKKYTLTLAGESKVGDQPVTLIKVSTKGHHDVTLGINPQSGALLKVSYKATLEDDLNKVVTYEAINEEYKSSGGVKYPSKTRITRAGKKFIESTITEYKPVLKLDQKLFAKPK